MGTEEKIKKFAERGDILSTMNQYRTMLPISNMMEELQKSSTLYLEFLAGAFIKEFGERASEYELVATLKPRYDFDNRIEATWSFRKKNTQADE